MLCDFLLFSIAYFCSTICFLFSQVLNYLLLPTLPSFPLFLSRITQLYLFTSYPSSILLKSPNIWILRVSTNCEVNGLPYNSYISLCALFFQKNIYSSWYNYFCSTSHKIVSRGRRIITIHLSY